MKNQHLCRTYFAIYGATDVDAVLTALNLNTDDVCVEENRLVVGFNNNYDVDVNNMIRITLKNLFDKAKQLAQLKQQRNLQYYLAIVPEIYSQSDAPNQMLSLADDVIAFLYVSNTQVDLDYYVC